MKGVDCFRMRPVHCPFLLPLSVALAITLISWHQVGDCICNADISALPLPALVAFEIAVLFV
jgi:hypothetical protein